MPSQLWFLWTLLLFLSWSPQLVHAVGAGAGNMGGAAMAGYNNPPPSGLIIGCSLAVFAVLIGGMFLGRYWLCQRWISTVQQARDNVIKDAENNGNQKQRPLSIPTAATKFNASYSDASKPNQQLCSSLGTIDFSTSASGSDLEHSKTTSSDCRTISGRGRDEDGDFVIQEGLVSLLTGKCYWLQEHTKARAQINQTCRQVLVMGIISNSNGIVTLEEGQWQANTYTSGSFLKFEATSTTKL